MRSIVNKNRLRVRRVVDVPLREVSGICLPRSSFVLRPRRRVSGATPPNNGLAMTAIQVPGLLSFTIAILVFFTGVGLNRLIGPLQRWNIPEAVTGGLLAAIVTLLVHTVFGVEISFSLDARDMLLLYFFTGIGLNAKLNDLVSGGRPLIVLLALTLVYLVIQNLVAAGSVVALGLPRGITAVVGSASLIGGHGTTIAWAPMITQRFGLSNALEVGIATATLGLVIANSSAVQSPVSSSDVIISAVHQYPTQLWACPTTPTKRPSTISVTSGFCARSWCSTWLS